ncbi:hypothetical protein L3Q65_00765 (plasmid) [Amycolatopsis sp. FU40]|uniref:hypothetical protein n=1 Tax=Amycolatopsis sp. FU40 TaxID=2914159 RepID=UPI001F1A4BB1|nr:hypothetical protein [Amycolatopsis sp. FU40]UKD50857.1 hypothetical protein L3Q65_00765 [Amycolatopsis sp. FU40]
MLILVLAAAAAVYLLTAWIWPHTACADCSGSGRRFSPTGKNFGPCGHCGGSGKKLRLAARIAGRTDT